MHKWFDHYTKSGFKALLGPVGELATQHEIASTDAQAADAWYQPNPAMAALRSRLGWLGKMGSRPCLLESFKKSPDEHEVRECNRKLYTLQHERVADATKMELAVPPLPWLWLMVPSVQRVVHRGFDLRPIKGWPAGFTRSCRSSGLRCVSLSEVPRTRETLLLRLLAGPGPVFQQALADQKNLPDDAWEKGVTTTMLLARIDEGRQNRFVDDPDARAFVEMTEERVEELKRQLREEGERIGLHKGLHEGEQIGLHKALLAAYRTRFGRVPHRIKAAVLATADCKKLNRWLMLFLSASPVEIASVVTRSSNGYH